ncbi:hypothetical protein M407DRAFT_4262 [Tulasnella calospora MUT 4182]|uniref:Uncharacterized protein n=1 Tax=Tulasnella calospora MUT 4182 TaxID=1051891 RepID=A0A0C3QVN9_9AGAM|nr:hypothetical protein M407DRAFT_4262 [Tulasnella calospora MUT 4182]
MASPATENGSRGRGSSRGGRGGPGGRGRGGRGRGRGGTRTPSISSPVDLSSPTTPTNTDSTLTKPADDKPPSLLSRIDMGATNQSPRSPKANSPSSPRSAVNSPSTVGDGTPTRGRGGGPRGSRGRKNSAASNGPHSPKVTNVSSPLSRRPPVSNSPLTSTTSSPKATPPHLLNVVDAASPKNSPSQLSKELEPSQLLEIRSSSVHPSPAPSPRPFTPMTRDWAAEDDDEDGGSLPSLDDWGLPGVKTASEAGDVKPQDQPSITEPMTKLSLKTDVKKTRGKRSGSAPQSASESPASASPAVANVIPPTPVSTRPGQTQAIGNTTLKPSPLGPSTLGVPNLPGRPMSRTSSPAPLNLANDARRSPSPALLPGAHSPGPSPGLRPTSGGVALGVRSRPVSPAPDMGQFYPQASSSPRLGGNFNLSPSPNLAGNKFNHSRPTSPSFNQDASQPGSRQGSPKGRPRALSGGVSLGLAASDSANPAPGSPGFPDRPRDLASSVWRQVPASQPTPPVLLESPIPPTGPFTLPPKPEVQPSQTRPYDSNRRGRGSGPRGGRGGRGGHRGVGDTGRFDRFSSPNQPGSPYNPTSPENQAEFNNRPMSHDDTSGSPGPGSRANGAGSPRSVTSNSPAGRGRGHARAHSRPVIAPSSALSLINATLGSPQRAPKPSATNDSVPVTGA